MLQLRWFGALELIAVVADQLETRASSAVGVAISVTTNPASAYLGVAAGAQRALARWEALRATPELASAGPRADSEDG